jgi:hypothetical protein
MICPMFRFTIRDLLWLTLFVAVSAFATRIVASSEYGWDMAPTFLLFFAIGPLVYGRLIRA